MNPLAALGVGIALALLVFAVIAAILRGGWTGTTGGTTFTRGGT